MRQTNTPKGDKWTGGAKGGVVTPMPAVCAALRDALDEAGVKQETAADWLGVTQGTISRWRTDIEPSLSQLAEFERRLGLTKGALLVAGGYVAMSGVEAAISADSALTPKQRRWLRNSYEAAIALSKTERAAGQ